jgi:hypothetical protein
MTAHTCRPGFGIAATLFVLLLVGGIGTGGWYAVNVSREQRIREGAAILAEHALREYADASAALGVLDIDVGADSLVSKGRIETGDEGEGMYVVQVARTGETRFRVKSTGRMTANRARFVCSYDMTWDLDRELDPRRALAPNDGPLCNGARQRRPAESGTGLFPWDAEASR